VEILANGVTVPSKSTWLYSLSDEKADTNKLAATIVNEEHLVLANKYGLPFSSSMFADQLQPDELF
jgi:hypothetical protein